MHFHRNIFKLSLNQAEPCFKREARLPEQILVNEQDFSAGDNSKQAAKLSGNGKKGDKRAVE